MKLQLEQPVAASPETVFARISNFQNANEHIEGITRVKMLTEGPVGVGTRFEETRVMFGKETTETMEVTAFEPGRSYVLEATSCGARFISEMRVEPAPEGTRLALEVNSQAVTLFAKLMTPLGFLMKGPMKKAMQKDLEDIAKGLRQS